MKIKTISIVIVIVVLITGTLGYFFINNKSNNFLNKFYCEKVVNGKHSCVYGWGVQCYCIKKYKNAGKQCLNSNQCDGSKCLANPDQVDYAKKNSSLKLIKGSSELCKKNDSILLPDSLNKEGICQSFPIENWGWEWELNDGRLDFVHGSCIYY